MHVWRRQTGVIIGGREELLHQPLTLLLLRNTHGGTGDNYSKKVQRTKGANGVKASKKISWPEAWEGTRFKATEYQQGNSQGIHHTGSIRTLHNISMCKVLFHKVQY